MEDKRKQDESEESQLAPGMNGVEGLNQKATPKEVAEHDATRVIRLTYDEYDPSES